MGWLLLFLAVCAAVYVFYRTSVERQNERDEEAARENYRQRIARDPGNAAAREMLGDSLWNAGRLDEARDAYLAAVAVAGPHAPTERMQYRLRQLEQERMIRDGSAPPPRRDLLCPSCGEINVPTEKLCGNCGAALPTRTFREALRLPETIRAGKEVLAMLIVMGIAIQVFAAMPFEVKGCLIMATAIVCGWKFLQAIEGRKL
jgi:tetratricopeptide (TPR) repeat protein